MMMYYVSAMYIIMMLYYNLNHIIKLGLYLAMRNLRNHGSGDLEGIYNDITRVREYVVEWTR